MAKSAVVDVIDMSDTSLAQVVLSELRGVDTTIVKLYPMSNGAVRMVDEIITAAGGQRGSIAVLRLWGHGWLGTGQEQFLAGGADGSKHRSSLSAETMKSLDSGFDRLRFYFAPNARVELRACSVAKGAGKTMMVDLAKRWQARIHGAAESQFSTRWLAPIMEATPTGDFRSITGIQVGAKP
jgi:hypothetical protein